MKRYIFLVVCALVIVLLNGSCSASTAETVLDGYHAHMNIGMIDRALNYVADDATFKITAAPIAGTNGIFSGREAIRAWMEDVVDGEGTIRVYDMKLEGDTMTCQVNYKDKFVGNLGLQELEMRETAVVENGMIQSYELTWLPAAQARFVTVSHKTPFALRAVDPADRKFLTAGYIATSQTAEAWFRNVDPADRKFFFGTGCTQPPEHVEDVCDWKFFNEGYITNYEY